MFGIWNHPEAAKLTYLGLHALQHRGQEAAGIVASTDGHFDKHVGRGLVADVFDEETLGRLGGTKAIGHVRYSTAGGTGGENAQPFAVGTAKGALALAHNGNLVNADDIRGDLVREGAIFSTIGDTEVLVHLLARARAPRIVDRLREAVTQVVGAYTLVVMHEKGLIGLRDPNGFRPLVIGKVGDAYVLASESSALELIGADFVREVEPGEIVCIDDEGVGWVMEAANIPVIVKLTPNVGDISEPASAAYEAGADAVSLINTVKSIVGVDLDRMVPLPVVGDGSSNGGYCGPAVKPIALHLLGQTARVFPKPISGIGGISNWRDAAEFMALGSTSVQVCTAVMHYGYRIVEDMIEGLNDFLDEKGYASAMDLVGKASPAYKDWGALDMNYHVVADISPESCIGCQLCVVACLDGSHQCIHVPGMSDEEKKARGYVAFPDPASIPDRPVTAPGGTPGARVPFVHEEECVGCNLCQLVCPVEGTITMVEKRKGDPITWNERVAAGTDWAPGGLEATKKARGLPE